MSKGSRKRSNKNKEKVGSKKGVNKVIEKREKTIYEDFPVPTLNQTNANEIQEIFNISNTLAAFIKEYAEKSIQIKKMRSMAKKIEQERKPIIIGVAQNLFKHEEDYNSVAKDIRVNAEKLEKSLKLLHGQIEHRYEDYVTLLVRYKRFLERLIAVDGENIKKITGHYADKRTKQEEEIIFERDFEKLTDEDRKQLAAISEQIKTKKEQMRKN